MQTSLGKAWSEGFPTLGALAALVAAAGQSGLSLGRMVTGRQAPIGGLGRTGKVRQTHCTPSKRLNLLPQKAVGQFLVNPRPAVASFCSG
jgi:hypothetical protein